MTDQTSQPWNRYRLTVQALAFLLLIAAPLLQVYAGITFIQGWYQSISIGQLWFISPLEGLERLLVTKSLYGPLVVAMLIPVTLALLLGRVFCGWICPIHFLSDLSDRLRRLLTRKRWLKDHWLLPKQLLWLVLAGELLATMVLGAPLFVFLSPPGLVGRELMLLITFHTVSVEIGIILGVLLLNLITRRFFCRYLCPLGGMLAFLGRKRRLRVAKQATACNSCGICSRSCPLGLDPQNGEAAGPYCWNCGACIAACPQQALHFEWRQGRVQLPPEALTSSPVRQEEA